MENSNQGNFAPQAQQAVPAGMDFMTAVKTCFSKYADFNGRATRSEYWYFFLFQFICGIVLGWIPIVGWLVSLALLVPPAGSCMASSARHGQIRCLLPLPPHPAGRLDLRSHLALQRDSARRQPVRPPAPRLISSLAISFRQPEHNNRVNISEPDQKKKGAVSKCLTQRFFYPDGRVNQRVA